MKEEKGRKAERKGGWKEEQRKRDGRGKEVGSEEGRKKGERERERERKKRSKGMNESKKAKRKKDGWLERKEVEGWTKGG